MTWDEPRCAATNGKAVLIVPGVVEESGLRALQGLTTVKNTVSQGGFLRSLDMDQPPPLPYWTKVMIQVSICIDVRSLVVLFNLMFKVWMTVVDSSIVSHRYTLLDGCKFNLPHIMHAHGVRRMRTYTSHAGGEAR